MGTNSSTLKRWVTLPPPQEEGPIVTRGIEWDAYGIMKSCIFCDYIAQRKDKKLVYEDDHVVAFKPLKDAAKQHFLVVPKQHISNISDLIAEDTVMLDKLRTVAKEILKCQDESALQFSFHIPPWNSVGECRERNILSYCDLFPKYFETKLINTPRPLKHFPRPREIGSYINKIKASCCSDKKKLSVIPNPPTNSHDVYLTG